MSALGQKRTCAVQLEMSALGQKRTLRHVRPISALPPITDINRVLQNLRLVPEADTCELGHQFMSALAPHNICEGFVYIRRTWRTYTNHHNNFNTPESRNDANTVWASVCLICLEAADCAL